MSIAGTLKVRHSEPQWIFRTARILRPNPRKRNSHQSMVYSQKQTKQGHSWTVLLALEVTAPALPSCVGKSFTLVIQ